MKITPLINTHYCMQVYNHMVKKKLKMYIDKTNTLWHINDLIEILKPKTRLRK